MERGSENVITGSGPGKRLTGEGEEVTISAKGGFRELVMVLL